MKLEIVISDHKKLILYKLEPKSQIIVDSIKFISNIAGAHRITSVFLTICIMCFLICIYFQFFRTRPVVSPAATLEYTKDMRVTGLSSVKYHENRKTFSLQADKIELARKKIGFLRLGFFKTAEIHGLRINYFLYPDEEQTINDLTDFKKYILPDDSINLKHIKEVKIKHFEINFFQKKQLLSSLKSDFATMDFLKKGFILSGNVSFLSGDNKKLQSHYLQWMPDKNQFSVPGEYQLTTDGLLMKGRGLSCDYLLSCFDFVSVPDKHLLRKKTPESR